MKLVHLFEFNERPECPAFAQFHGDAGSRRVLDLRSGTGEPVRILVDWMSDDAVLDELRTLLVAGHETTATALAGALHFVHADDALARRLRDEVRGDDAPDALAGAALLGATCSEALRLYPVVPVVLRRGAGAARPAPRSGPSRRGSRPSASWSAART